MAPKKGGAVEAFDVKEKRKVAMAHIKPVYTVTAKGSRKYRLTGVSAEDSSHILNLFVSEAVAKAHGKPVEVAVKSKRAPKKSCEDKYNECLAKKPAKKSKAAKSPAAKRGRKKKAEAAASPSPSPSPSWSASPSPVKKEEEQEVQRGCCSGGAP